VEFVGKVYAITLEGDRIDSGGKIWHDTNEAKQVQGKGFF